MATATSQPPAEQQSGNKSFRDFRQEVTNNIVRMLEAGTAPWQRPWDPATCGADMPMNPTTGRAYRGGNAVHLMTTSLQKGYRDPRWMTYKQAFDRGWQVRKGEKGIHIEFWEVKPSSDKTPAREPDQAGAGTGAPARSSDAGKPRLIHRVYTVFNAEQVDRIPPHKPRPRMPFEVVQAGERILANSGANISHDQANQAFYNRSLDTIHLPPKDTFKDAPGYYGTALHELAHWSGHPSRLNRATLNESQRGDVNYAREELRAELASVFLAAERGIPHDPGQHAAYVGSWIRVLKEDKDEIFRAAYDASTATDFLLGLERERSIVEEALADDRAPAATLENETSEIRRDREKLEDSGMPDSLSEAQVRAARALGDSARTELAQTESGTYSGTVIGDAGPYIIQQQSSQLAVTHPKQLLDRLPEIGETVRINYSNNKGSVREFRERENPLERSR